MTRYRTIVADPPWTQPGSGSYSGDARWKNHARKPSELPYQTMTLQDIFDFPVSGLAMRDAHLYLWVTNAFIEAGYEVARTWGFNPSVLLTWGKTPRGIGLGGAFTQTTEHVLFCRRGSLKARQRVDTTWWNFKRPHNQHSAKPEGFQDVVEQVSPGPYLELFARRDRLGWDTWGNQSLGTAQMGAA
jgi:N6-adenosine-specific RNA methylase IME4